MKHIRNVACGLMLSGSVSMALAAPPVGQFTCENAALSFNVSYYDFGLTAPAAGSSAGVGKATRPVTTLEIRSALATFPKIVLPAADGRTISRCTLKTQASNGDYFEITFRNVLVQMVNAIASAAGAGSPRYAYVQTSFAFEDVEVSTVSSGVDDGGVSPAPTN